MQKGPKRQCPTHAEQLRRTRAEAYVPPANSALGKRMARALLTAPLFTPRVTTLRR